MALLGASDAAHGQTAPKPDALLRLPELTACEPSGRPQLPERWRAVSLMESFTWDTHTKKDKGKKNIEQIVVGEITYDATIPALRASLYGLEKGHLDLLVTATGTYRLNGSDQSPTGCTRLSKVDWQPPSRDWLSDKAQCIGQAPLREVEVQWWKTPLGIPANWIWYTTSSRLPWRTLFAEPAASPAVIGQFAMTYFPTFEKMGPEGGEKLSQLVQMCSGQTNPPDRETFFLMPALALSENVQPDAERLRRIQGLIPGLSYKACADHELPSFPQKFGMTTFMTPVNESFTPFPTEVLYEASATDPTAIHLRTRMFSPSTARQIWNEALLLGDAGYDIVKDKNGSFRCTQALPGPPVQSWMQADGCQCKGVLHDNPQLSPGSTTLLVRCPLEYKSSSFWMWYTQEGRPIVFMQTQTPANVGTGLTLADYYSWHPGMEIPEGTFQLPKDIHWGKKCPPPNNQTAAASTASEGSAHLTELPSFHGGPIDRVAPQGCFHCHLPLSHHRKPDERP